MRKALQTRTEFLKLQIFELENKIKDSGFCCKQGVKINVVGMWV